MDLNDVNVQRLSGRIAALEELMLRLVLWTATEDAKRIEEQPKAVLMLHRASLLDPLEGEGRIDVAWIEMLASLNRLFDQAETLAGQMEALVSKTTGRLS